MPHDFIFSILFSALPLSPEIIAPACPILLPGGAVLPAMKPTIGFLTFEDLMNSAASSSEVPPISPIINIHLGSSSFSLNIGSATSLLRSERDALSTPEKSRLDFVLLAYESSDLLLESDLDILSVFESISRLEVARLRPLPLPLCRDRPLLPRPRRREE